MKHNDSFLSDVQSNLDEARTEAFVRRFFDDQRSAELRMKYDFLSREYQMRQNHNLLDADAELAYMERFVDQRKEAIKSMTRHQQRKTHRQVKAAERRGDISAPVKVSSTLASVYFGEPLHLPLSDSTKFIAKTDFYSERAQLQLSSKIIDGSVDFASTKAMEEAKKADPNSNPEQYRVSLSRGLGLWDLSSGVSYGHTSNSIGASLSKPLTENLTCVVDRNQKISNSAETNETVKLQYGINF